jgi:hypothetical protein
MLARRGFTLLEVALASALGVVILAVCLAMLSTLERADRLLEVRAVQTGDQQRIHRVMQRVAGSLLLGGERQRRRTTTTSLATPVATPEGEQPAEPSLADPAKPPPRFILMQDPALQGVMMTRRVSQGTVVAMAPQRLEVVLTDSPVPGVSRTMEIIERAGARADDALARDERASDEARAGAGAKDGARDGFADGFDEDLSTPPVRAMRGALVFVIAEASRAQRRQLAIREDGPVGSGELSSSPLFELWWVPLPPRPQEGWEAGIERAYGPTEGSYKIAGDIRFARWQIFSKRERKSTAMVTTEAEIPAFIELEIELGSGIWSNWMFEVPLPARGDEPVPEGEGSGDSEGKGAQASEASRTRGEPARGVSGTRRRDGVLSDRESPK